jgi:hypothetical protein
MLHRHNMGRPGVRGRTVAQDTENLDNDGVTGSRIDENQLSALAVPARLP